MALSLLSSVDLDTSLMLSWIEIPAFVITLNCLKAAIKLFIFIFEPPKRTDALLIMSANCSSSGTLFVSPTFTITPAFFVFAKACASLLLFAFKVIFWRRPLAIYSTSKNFIP